MNTDLKQLTMNWDKQTDKVFGLEKLDLSEMQAIIKDTYKTLHELCKEERVPKEAVKLFLHMDDFLYFAELMEEKEVGKSYYCWEEFKYIADALKEGFFKGEYPEAYPVMLITDIVDNSYLFDLEKDKIEDYIIAVRNTANQPI